ncbi:MAG TPA: 30S ribosomal protein S20 [Candidatus Binataceae bacterium]|nr:30S ribosomal protein S20 [Candidatus Binataceae bacterium]
MPHIPNHPSARKRHRQSLKRQTRNRAIKTRVRTASKQALEAIESNDRQAGEAALRNAMKVLHKAASKGTIKRNTASRKIARLSRRLHTKQAASAQS